MKLNLGAGLDIKTGDEWVNIDLRPFPGVDLVADVRRLPFSEASADEILASDVLEHLPTNDVYRTLKEWRRVLKPGGEITIRIPHLTKIFRKALRGSLSANVVIRLIYGNQKYGGEEHPGNFHRSGLTEDQICRIMRRVGFKVVSVESPEDEHNLVVVARKNE